MRSPRKRSPQKLGEQLRWELIALMHWDERIGRAVRRAEKEYIAAGSPPIPLSEYDYRKKFQKEKTEK